MDKQIKHCIEIYKENRYKIISDKMMEVDTHSVKEQIKKGRVVMTCDCENSTKFAHLNICRHKLFYLYLPLLELWNKRIDHLIEYYSVNKDISKDEEQKRLSGFFCSDLEELKNLR